MESFGSKMLSPYYLLYPSLHQRFLAASGDLCSVMPMPSVLVVRVYSFLPQVRTDSTVEWFPGEALKMGIGAFAAFPLACMPLTVQ